MAIRCSEVPRCLGNVPGFALQTSTPSAASRVIRKPREEWRRAGFKAAALILVPIATGARRQTIRRGTTKVFASEPGTSMPTPHLIKDTWYDKTGTPEQEAAEIEPALHLLQAHRDSFKHFLQHWFAFELRRLSEHVKLMEDSVVFISETEASLKGIRGISGPLPPKVVAAPISDVLPAAFQLQRFSAHLLLERLYFLESAESAALVERRQETYTATAVVPMHVTDRETGLTFTAQVRIGSFPMLLEDASLIVSGNPYIVVHRLERAAGPYFSTESPTPEAKPLHTLELCTEEYSRIRCRCYEDEEDLLCLEILMPKSNIPLPACLVLLAIGLKPTQIKKARNAGLIWTKEHDFLENNDDDPSWVAATELCYLLDLNTERFNGDPVAAFNFKTSWSFGSRVGPLGRRRFNERLGLDLTDMKLTPKDFLASFDLLVDSYFGRASLQPDDIDSLNNKRLRCIGQKMQGLVRNWLLQVEEKAGCFPVKVDAAKGTGVVCLDSCGVRGLKDFCVSELWKENNRQMLDCVNPLAEVVQARRISQVSELGLDKIKRIQGIRLIHASHYGRICPIETGEGMNAGIVMAMASNTRVTLDGEMEAPHQRVCQGC